MRSGLLAWIRWSVCMLKSHRSLCKSFSWTGAGFCIYHLFVWSNWNLLYISQWTTLPNQSCLALYSFCAIIIIIIIIPQEFFTSVLADSKSPQVSRTRLSILAVLSNAVVWIASTRPPTSKSSRPFNNPLVTVPYSFRVFHTGLSWCSLNWLVLRFPTHPSLLSNLWWSFQANQLL